MDIRQLIESRNREKYQLHESYLNAQMVRVLKTLGFDRNYVRADGPYLYDEQGERYLDLLSGFGVFALGRNHPKVIATLEDVLHAGLPNLVQLDVSTLAGLLAERLSTIVPAGLERFFFTNSGTEAVEAAIKFSRYATGRTKIISCHGSFHGLSMGSLSATDDLYFRDGFGPFVPEMEQIPFNDLQALEQALANKDVAAFIVEPIQGHGVHMPDDDYLPNAARICRQHGTLLVADEVQTGLGRTGRMWAVEHWSVEPDLLCMAKALSGGFVPVGAIACRKWVFDKVFNCMDRAVIHSTTFGKNNLAMAAGLATLEVLEEEKLVENAARIGRQIIAELSPLVEQYELLKEVRGLGLMIGLEFEQPNSTALKVSWKLMEKVNKNLFCQTIIVPLLTRHRILSQVAGHDMHIIKFLPALVINDDDRRWIVEAVSDVVAEAHRLPGAIWDLGKTLTRQALKSKAGAR